LIFFQEKISDRSTQEKSGGFSWKVRKKERRFTLFYIDNVAWL
jgi:hypothetical protein